MRTLIARLQIYSAYWAIRRFARHQRFRWDQFSYGVGDQVTAARLSVSILLQLIKLGINGIVVSALIIAAAEIAEHILRSIFSDLNPRFWALEPNYQEFESLIGQIGATFLGIYFATFGIVISSGYQSIRNDVIDLILREKINNIYSSFLIYLTVISLSTSGLHYFGLATGKILFALIAVGGMVAVLCLFELGKRLFLFFDTSRLAEGEIAPEIARTIGILENDGASDSIHLQAHYQRVAQKRIETLRYLSRRAHETGALGGDAIGRIDEKYAQLLTMYARAKGGIPRDSYWFRRVRKHPNWFLESDSSTSMALQLDMYLLPKEEPDFEWFEEELSDGLAESFESSVRARTFETANRTLRMGQIACEELAKSHSAGAARRVLQRFAGTLTSPVGEPELPLQPAQDVGRDEISMHEGVSHAFMSFAIEYCRAGILHARRLQNRLDAVDWDDPSFAGFPASVAAQLRLARNRIDFERQVGRSRITPNSFIMQLLARDFVAGIAKTLGEVEADLTSATVERVDRLTAEGRLEIATPILLSSFRGVAQLRGFIDQLEDSLVTIYESEKFPEYAIERIDFAHFRRVLSDLRERLVRQLSSSATLGFVTAKLEHDGELPDYFGQCYFMLAEECYDALAENKTALFKSLFSSFFVIGQMAFYRIDAEKDKFSTDYRVALTATVAEDLLAITGYAYLYADFHGNDALRETVVTRWLAHLATAVPDLQAYLRWILAVTNYLASAFAARPRDIIRTRWDMHFEKVLSNAGFGDGVLERRRGNLHPSPLIRSVGGLSFHKVSHVPVALLFLDKLTGNYELPASLDSLLSTLERERKR